MKKVPALTTAFTIALALTGCSAGNNDVFESKLQQQDPLAFARYFVETVQPPADIETYNRFLHPEGQVEATPDGKGIGEFYLKNAVSENEYIAENDLLASPRLQMDDESADISYNLPQQIKYDIVYPHSPFADEPGWVIREGQILLKKSDGRWVIAGHTMVGEQENP
jgi:hypothetical protein